MTCIVWLIYGIFLLLMKLFYRNKKVLITGGAGFLGSFLVENLLQAQARVTVVDNLSTGRKSNLKKVLPQITFLKSDARTKIFRNWLSRNKFDYFFHLAANPYIPPSVENPEYDFKENLLMVFNFLEIIRHQKKNYRPKLIFISTAGVYGNPKRNPITEEIPVDPISPYGVSKLASEQYVKIYHQLYDLQTLAVRMFPIYGPRQTKQVVFDFIKKLDNNPKFLKMFGDGSQSRDFIYVEDAARGLLQIAKKSKFQGEIYNLASGKETMILEIAKKLASLMRIKPIFKFTPLRQGDAKNWRADISRVQALGFKPSTNLKTGLQKTLDWYFNEYQK